jgi:hypothetical protein
MTVDNPLAVPRNAKPFPQYSGPMLHGASATPRYPQAERGSPSPSPGRSTLIPISTPPTNVY